MPQISVIVPVYRAEKFLHRCVDSVLGQTFRDFELILLDDGSPDGSGAICDAYAARDSRVRAIHQGNAGVCAARNTCLDWVLSNSDSQWIFFIDNDDWMHPRRWRACIGRRWNRGRRLPFAAMRRRREKTRRFPRNSLRWSGGFPRIFTCSALSTPRSAGESCTTGAALTGNGTPWASIWRTNF